MCYFIFYSTACACKLLLKNTYEFTVKTFRPKSGLLRYCITFLIAKLIAIGLPMMLTLVSLVSDKYLTFQVVKQIGKYSPVIQLSISCTKNTAVVTIFVKSAEH